MDETRDESQALAADLLLEAGWLMEDACVEFALSMPDAQVIDARAQLLEQLAAELQGLVSAAQALLRSSHHGELSVGCELDRTNGALP